MKRHKHAGRLAGAFAFGAFLVIAGCVLGTTYAWLSTNGWFQAWSRVAAPPERAVGILAISGPALWVRTQSGAVYHNAFADTCATDCWFAVVEVPATLERDPEVREVRAKTCVTPPPALGAVERVAECQRSFWLDYDTIYIRRSSGALLVWRFTSGGEWGYIDYLSGMLIGAVGLLGLGAGGLAMKAVVRWIKKRQVPRMAGRLRA